MIGCDLLKQIIEDILAFASFSLGLFTLAEASHHLARILTQPHLGRTVASCQQPWEQEVLADLLALLQALR